MARFDVFRLANGALVVDCQADFLAGISTRFVLPLMPSGEAPPAQPRLNPTFQIDGEPLVLVTQFAAALQKSELRTRVGSLATDYERVTGALDVLTGTG